MGGLGMIISEFLNVVTRFKRFDSIIAGENRFFKKYWSKFVIFLIISCIIVSPVIGSRIPVSLGHLGGSENSTSNIWFEQQVKSLNNTHLTPAKEKMSSDLITLVALQNDPLKNQNEIIRGLKSVNLYKFADEMTGNEANSKGKSDIVRVWITVWPGNSTAILDPYIHLPTEHVEGFPEISPWVDVSRIYEIANLPEVKIINTESPPFFNIGSVTTESDTVLHSDIVRNTHDGVNGTGIKTGVQY